MALPSIAFLRALVRWGNLSDDNKAQLTTWQGAALESIAAGNGGMIAMGGGNGVNFQLSIMPSAMTNQEWFTVLDLALNHIETGTRPANYTLARVL